MIYIVSDVHLGLTSSLKPEIARENFITFVNGIESGAHLYILGDLLISTLEKGINLFLEINTSWNYCINALKEVLKYLFLVVITISGSGTA